MKRINPYLNDESLAVPWIFPHAITVDGGADFRSATFEAACRAFGITIVLAPPNAPATKPHVERNFGTTSTDFAQWLAGSTGNSLLTVKHDNPTLTLDSVRLAFDAWITTVFMNKQHGGLRSPLFPVASGHRTRCTRRCSKSALEFSFRSERRTSLLFFPPKVGSSATKDRVPESQVRLAAGGGPSNRSLSGAPAGSRQARTFAIRFDPCNDNAVWVQHPETAEWIECWDKGSTIGCVDGGPRPRSGSSNALEPARRREAEDG